MLSSDFIKYPEWPKVGNACIVRVIFACGRFSIIFRHNLEVTLLDSKRFCAFVLAIIFTFIG